MGQIFLIFIKGIKGGGGENLKKFWVPFFRVKKTKRFFGLFSFGVFSPLKSKNEKKAFWGKEFPKIFQRKKGKKKFFFLKKRGKKFPPPFNGQKPKKKKKKSF